MLHREQLLILVREIIRSNIFSKVHGILGLIAELDGDRAGWVRVVGSARQERDMGMEDRLEERGLRKSV